MRQIVLDTETTGLLTSEGHRIIEIGCVELINRQLTGRHFHYYIQPQRKIDEGALAIHGITEEFLKDKPLFNHIVDSLIEFIKDGELIIHNAAFDVEFLDYEFKLAGQNYGKVKDHCQIFDTLHFARRKHPGQQNSLDALCRRYSIDNSGRNLHGALLDANLLAEVYLAMTGGQTTLFIDHHPVAAMQIHVDISHKAQVPLRIIYANNDEIQAHQQYLKTINETSGGNCLWHDPEGAD